MVSASGVWDKVNPPVALEDTSIDAPSSSPKVAESIPRHPREQ